MLVSVISALSLSLCLTYRHMQVSLISFLCAFQTSTFCPCQSQVVFMDKETPQLLRPFGLHPSARPSQGLRLPDALCKCVTRLLCGPSWLSPSSQTFLLATFPSPSSSAGPSGSTRQPSPALFSLLHTVSRGDSVHGRLDTTWLQTGNLQTFVFALNFSAPVLE